MAHYRRQLRVTDSRALDWIGYDFEERLLLIHFRDGSYWLHRNVPHTAFGQLACAFSVGKAYNELIRTRFDAERVHAKVIETTKSYEQTITRPQTDQTATAADKR